MAHPQHRTTSPRQRAAPQQTPAAPQDPAPAQAQEPPDPPATPPSAPAETPAAPSAELPAPFRDPALRGCTVLLQAVVCAPGRLSQGEARRLLRDALPGPVFVAALAAAVERGYALGLDGECLCVTARGRRLRGVMPPGSRVVRLVEGASWEHPHGPPARRRPEPFHL